MSKEVEITETVTETETTKNEGEMSVMDALSRYKWWILGGIGVIVVAVIVMKRRSNNSPEQQPPASYGYPPWAYPAEPELERKPRRPPPPKEELTREQPRDKHVEGEQVVRNQNVEEDESDFEEKNSRVISVESIQPAKKEVEVNLKPEKVEQSDDEESEDDSELESDKCKYTFKRGDKAGLSCTKNATKGDYCAIHAPKK